MIEFRRVENAKVDFVRLSVLSAGAGNQFANGCQSTLKTLELLIEVGYVKTDRDLK